MAHVFVSGLAAVDFVFRLDTLPKEPEKYKAQGVSIVGGGGAANAAVAVARLGGQASLGARLGRDHIGDIIIRDLQAEGVGLGGIRRSAGANSAFSSIYVTANGDRQIVSFRGSGLAEDAGWLEMPETVDAVLADTRWPAGARKTMEIAKSRGIPGIIDAEAPVHPADLVAASHVAFSRQGLIDFSGEPDITKALKLVSETCQAWVCVTDGEAGVYFMEGPRVENIPAFPVVALDTLGAGDIWHGAFALRLGEGTEETEAMKFANAAAALKCTKSGGREGCPDRSAAHDLLNGRTL